MSGGDGSLFLCCVTTWNGMGWDGMRWEIWLGRDR